MTQLDPLAFQRGFQGVQDIIDTGRRNKLAQLAFDQKERELQSKNALAGILSSPDTYDEQGNLRREALPKIASADPSQFLSYRKVVSEQEQAQRDAKKAQREELIAQFDWADKNIANVRDQASWDEFRQRAAAVYPDVAARLPAQFDPAQIQQNRMKMIPVIEQWKEEQLRERQAQQQQFDREKFEYQKTNDAANRDVTIRGQNMTNQRALETAQVSRENKATEALDKKVNALSTQLDKTNIPQFESLLSDIEADISRFAKGDIPGYGPVAGNLPQFMLTREGQMLRQKIAQLQNLTLKDRSGAAVTNQELQRLLNEIGTGVFSTDDQLRSGLANVRRNLDAVKRNVVAGVDENTLREYQARGGLPLVRGEPQKPAAAGASQTRKVVRSGTYNGRKVVQYSDGTVEYQ